MRAKKAALRGKLRVGRTCRLQPYGSRSTSDLPTCAAIGPPIWLFRTHYLSVTSMSQSLLFDVVLCLELQSIRS